MTPKFTKSHFLLTALILVCLLSFATWGTQALSTLTNLSTANFGSGFSYQGQLADPSGTPISDICTLQFGLYTASAAGTQLGSTQTFTDVVLQNGLFTVTLNGGGEFGPNAFNGDPRWLEISVQCTGDISATTLGRQPINPVPYALFAERFAGYSNVIVVAKENGDFSSVSAAMSAIGVNPNYPPAAADNPYLIYVAPGIYDDSMIVMKPYVEIEGAGQGLTIIRHPSSSVALHPSAAVVVSAQHTALRNLTIENSTPISNTSDYVIGLFTEHPIQLTHVTISTGGGAFSTPLFLFNSGSDPLPAHMLTLNASGGSDQATGLHLENGAFMGSHLSINAVGSNNTYAINVVNSSDFKLIDSQINLIGQGDNDAGLLVGSNTLASFDNLQLNYHNAVGGGRAVWGLVNSHTTITNSQIIVTGLDEPIQGLYIFNAHLTLFNTLVEVTNSNPAKAFHIFGSLDGDYQVEVDQSQFKVTESGGSGISFAFHLETSVETAFINGYINNSQFDYHVSDDLSVNGKYGLLHNSYGNFSYSNNVLNFDQETEANEGGAILFGRGTVAVSGLTVNANSTSNANFTGLATSLLVNLNLHNVKMVVNHFDPDATNITSAIHITTVGRVTLSDINLAVQGNGTLYGLRISVGDVVADNITISVRDLVQGGGHFGVNCFASASLDITNSSIRMQGPSVFDGVGATSMTGMHFFGCNARVNHTTILHFGDQINHTGINLFGTTVVNVSNATIEFNSANGGIANSNQTGINISANNHLFGDNVKVVISEPGPGQRRAANLAATTGAITLELRNSTLESTENLFTLSGAGAYEINISNSVLIGPVAANPITQCTGVTRVVGGVYSFIGAPEPCD